MGSKQYCVYILASANNRVLYIGVTSDLRRRMYEHRLGLRPGFTKRYRVTKLVHFEVFRDSYNAISREKQLKAGSRQRKIELIEGLNPAWRDLAEDLFENWARGSLRFARDD